MEYLDMHLMVLYGRGSMNYIYFAYDAHNVKNILTICKIHIGKNLYWHPPDDAGKGVINIFQNFTSVFKCR